MQKDGWHLESLEQLKAKHGGTTDASKPNPLLIPQGLDEVQPQSECKRYGGTSKEKYESKKDTEMVLAWHEQLMVQELEASAFMAQPTHPRESEIPGVRSLSLQNDGCDPPSAQSINICDVTGPQAVLSDPSNPLGMVNRDKRGEDLGLCTSKRVPKLTGAQEQPEGESEPVQLGIPLLSHERNGSRRYFSPFKVHVADDTFECRPYQDLHIELQSLALLNRGIEISRTPSPGEPPLDRLGRSGRIEQRYRGHRRAHSEFFSSRHSQIEGDETVDITQNTNLDLPSHLVPFIPYIERSSYWPRSEARLLDPPRSWIRLETIRNWLRICNANHGYPCVEYEEQRSGSWGEPFLLMDVQDWCLVRASTHANYVALSYVWGRTESSCTNTDNLDALLEHGSLKDGPVALPKTIIDAMELVLALGERYLWVDRFCIVQNDGPAKQSQLNAMDRIYANSSFTIFAAQNGDASDGLYGTRRVRNDNPGPEEEFALPHRPLKLGWGSESHRQNMLDHARRLMQTEWYSRGWVFQEHLFSPRKLVFHGHTVNWECLCAAWHESLDLSDEHHTHQIAHQRWNSLHPYSPRSGFDHTPWPNMFRYSRLVSMYNRRALTYPEDILDAFAGTLSALSRTFAQGFISGLPQFCFDAALLWQPWDMMERRVSAHRPSSKSVLPSWSWAGWSGTLNSESWRSASAYIREHADMSSKCSWITHSTVSWEHSETLDGKRKPVLIPPLIASRNLDHENVSLPEGWTMHVNENGETIYRHGCDPSQEFLYPIPIRDQNRAHVPPTNSRYLHGHTRRAFFKLGKAYSSAVSVCTAVDVLTISGAWAGVLRLNHSAADDTSSAYLGVSVELIEISAGSVKDQALEEESFDEWNRSQCPRHDGSYEFFNVLWVEWVAGVAYRKALGRVVKSIWEEEKRENIRLVLG